MKKIAVILTAMVVLSACGGSPSPSEYRRFSFEFFYAFDTVTAVTAFARNEQEFDELRLFVHGRMMELHRLYSIFNGYDGVVNIKAVNDNAGVAPVKVCADILDLLEFSVEWHDKTDGAFNVALGAVLRVWHEYRTRYRSVSPGCASLPDMERLMQLSELTDINDVIIDRENSTVFLALPGMSLDVGSVAKGFAVQRVVDEARAAGFAVTDFLINAGGNVAVSGVHRLRATGLWQVEVVNPLNNETLAVFDVENGMSVVTSGGNQRYFMYGERAMGHIISPFTLMPADGFASITVVAGNSAAADVLSTAMFIVSHQDGLGFAEQNGVSVVWLLPDGEKRAFP